MYDVRGRHCQRVSRSLWSKTSCLRRIFLCTFVSWQATVCTVVVQTCGYDAGQSLEADMLYCGAP